jgi:hydrogenase maturation protein HypF
VAGTGIEKGARLRYRITVRSTVQGVGFRPFVYQLAARYQLAGWVCNTGGGVLIEVEGEEEKLCRFVQSIKTEAPALAVVSDVQAAVVPTQGDAEFVIRRSVEEQEVQPIVPPDVAMCPECTADVLTPGNRRHRYPFTNCTNCGPRFTIIRRIPYDRPNTTMKRFRMCPECQAEYDDPANRRFHAQPNACPACGPHLALDGRKYADDSEAISLAARLLREGKVLAIKGLGGYHLACDARNTEAVDTLRERKGRAGKPFALMCADLDEVRRICRVEDESERLLLSFERPIVLLPARSDGGVSPLVAPGIGTLGVMLPYTPLHHLLLAESPPSLVMTSGNLTEEPIIHRDEDALERLGPIADHILSHDRPIHMACDDSVARVQSDSPMILRRARGYVPRPIELDIEMPPILACGGDLKSTFCLTKGRLALLSQHLGDLDNVPTLEHYRRVIEHFCRFFAVQPEIVAHDLHPDYRSTSFALSTDVPRRVGVQHHHAHIASCMAENRLEGAVICVAFDGTGYGTDGRIWGGEFLVADYDYFQRAAHLAYVPLPGGEAAIRRPARMALAYLLRAFGPAGESLGLQVMPSLSAAEGYAVRTQIEKELNSPLTSSMGRLFDAASALLGVCTEVRYEGQAAIELEARACESAERAYAYHICKNGSGAYEIDVAPTIREIVEDLKAGISVGLIASTFHATIADMIAAVCAKLREDTGLSRVALSGGVFQNVLLLEQAVERLESAGFEVFRQSVVPCNDGGISLGQAVIAVRRCAS